MPLVTQEGMPLALMRELPWFGKAPASYSANERSE